MAKLTALCVLGLVACTYASCLSPGKTGSRISRAANPLPCLAHVPFGDSNANIGKDYVTIDDYNPNRSTNFGNIPPNGNNNPRRNGNGFGGNNYNPPGDGVQSDDGHGSDPHEDVIVDADGRVIDRYIHIKTANGQDVNIHSHGANHNPNHQSPLHKPGAIELNV